MCEHHLPGLQPHVPVDGDHGGPGAGTRGSPRSTSPVFGRKRPVRERSPAPPRVDHTGAQAASGGRSPGRGVRRTPPHPERELPEFLRTRGLGPRLCEGEPWVRDPLQGRSEKSSGWVRDPRRNPHLAHQPHTPQSHRVRPPGRSGRTRRRATHPAPAGPRPPLGNVSDVPRSGRWESTHRSLVDLGT